MSERLKLGLVSLWLFLSFPFNVIMLKVLIRDVFWLTASLDAGLDRWLAAQFLLAMVFVLGVEALLLMGVRLGRTLAVVLLLGSCCAIAGSLLLDMVYSVHHLPFHRRLIGGIICGVVVLLNMVCLRALAVRKMPESTASRFGPFFAKKI